MFQEVAKIVAGRILHRLSFFQRLFLVKKFDFTVLQRLVKYVFLDEIKNKY